MKTTQFISAATALAGLALVGSAANAATWTYSSTGPTSSAGLTATASAFSATNNATSTITATTAYYSGGLGVKSTGEVTTSPQHAIDNNNSTIETVMLSFSNGVGGITSADKVNLTSASFGWVGSLSSTIAKDSDFSVYAYTGSSAAPSPLGVSYANLTSNGWTLIGHFDGGSSTGTKTFANSVYSSNWLIGAYNGLGSGTGLDSANDFFKMASVSGNLCPTVGTPPAGCNGGSTPGGVPEPGTLLLMGAGLLGLTRMTRRKVS